MYSTSYRWRSGSCRWCMLKYWAPCFSRLCTVPHSPFGMGRWSWRCRRCHHRQRAWTLHWYVGCSLPCPRGKTPDSCSALSWCCHHRARKREFPYHKGIPPRQRKWLSFQLQRGLQRERKEGEEREGWRGRGRREGIEGGAGGRCREGEKVKEWEEGQRSKEGVGTKEAWVLLVTVQTWPTVTW